MGRVPVSPPWYIHVMYDHNQLEVPDSFMALHGVAGRVKPGLTRAHITGRYELCEDLAQHLREYARAQHHDHGLAEEEVLRRCHQGLLADPAGLSVPEAAWVVRRLAELADWARPDLGDPAPDGVG
jgi:hypothetical protein